MNHYKVISKEINDEYEVVTYKKKSTNNPNPGNLIKGEIKRTHKKSLLVHNNVDTLEAKSIVKNILIKTINKNKIFNSSDSETINFVIGEIKNALNKYSSNIRQQGTILECIVSYLLWEVFERDEDLFNALVNIKEGDGFDAIFWIPFARWNRPGKKIIGFNRSVEDAIKMIEIMYKSGIDPLKKNVKNENIFQALDEGIAQGFTLAEWKEPLEETFKGGFLTELSIRTISKSVINKVTSAKVNDYATKFCWVLRQDSNGIIAKEIVKIFLTLQHNNHDGSGYWAPVRNMMDNYRRMILIGPSVDFVSDWNAHDQLHKLYNSIYNEIRDIVGKNSFHDTQCRDCLGAIVGECKLDNHETYLLKCIEEERYMDFTYCLSHSRCFSKEVMKELIKIYDVVPAILKFQFSEIIKSQFCPVYLKVIVTCGDNKFEKTFDTTLTSAVAKEIVRLAIIGKQYSKYNELYNEIRYAEGCLDLERKFGKTKYVLLQIEREREIVFEQKYQTPNLKTIEKIVLNKIRENCENRKMIQNSSHTYVEDFDEQYTIYYEDDVKCIRRLGRLNEHISEDELNEIIDDICEIIKKNKNTGTDGALYAESIIVLAIDTISKEFHLKTFCSVMSKLHTMGIINNNDIVVATNKLSNMIDTIKQNCESPAYVEKVVNRIKMIL